MVKTENKEGLKNIIKRLTSLQSKAADIKESLKEESRWKGS